MKKLVSILLFIIALPSFAAERQFDIELIIFKRAVDPNQLNESWPNALPPIDFSNVGTLEDSKYREQKNVSILSEDKFQLLDQVNKLKEHAGYQVLLHKAWRQGDQGKSSSPKFRIRAGKDYSKSYYADGSQKITFIDDTNDGEIQEQTIDKPLYELDGEIQVYVQHYLFLETTLDLKAPGVRDIILEDKELKLTDTDSNNTVQFGNMEEVSPTIQEERFLKSYRMKQKRRMRSSETHYLDHPLMGIIIQVRRVPQS